MALAGFDTVWACVRTRVSFNPAPNFIDMD
jgi:hypothetical protein